MAEVIVGLGLVASCAEILKTLDGILLLARKSIHTRSAAKKELVPLLGKLTAHEGLIRGIKCEAEYDEVDHIRLKAFTCVDGPLLACESAVTTIHARLMDLSSHVVFGKIVDKKTARALQTLDELKPILELAFAADQRTITKAIETYVQGIQSDVHALREEHSNEVESRQQFEADQQRETVLVWTSLVDPRSNFRAAHSSLQPGTSSGQWLFTSLPFQSWKNGELSSLWLRGPYKKKLFQRSVLKILIAIAGCGKTVLAAMVITHLRQSVITQHSNARLIYFFFDFKNPDKQAVEHLARSLIAQLAFQDQDAYAIVNAFYKTHRGLPAYEIISTREWLSLLEKLLRTKSGGTCYIVIDALDEYHEQDVLPDISRFCKDHENVRLFLTSQENSLFDTYMPAHIVKFEMKTEVIDEDIKGYVQARLMHDSLLRSYSSEKKEMIQEAVTGKSRGMFRWAQCQLDSLRTMADRRMISVQRALELLPQDLTLTYQRLLTAITPPAVELLVRHSLEFLAFGRRSIKLTEFAEYAVLEEHMTDIGPEERFEDPTQVLKLCGTFVVQQDDIVTLAHKSVKDFLLAKRGQKTASLSTAASEIETEIGRTCLSYLASLVPAVLGDEDQLANTKSPNSLRYPMLQASYPLMDYACSMWTRCFEDADDRQLPPQGFTTAALQLDGETNIWKAWLMLQKAEIWERQIELSLTLCEAIIQTSVKPGWAADFWYLRQDFREQNRPYGPSHERAAFTINEAGTPTKAGRTRYHVTRLLPPSRVIEHEARPIEYYLAKILIEIALQCPIAELRNLMNDELGDLVNKAQNRMGIIYGDAIRACCIISPRRGLMLPGAPTEHTKDWLHARIILPLRASISAAFRSLYRPLSIPRASIDISETWVESSEKQKAFSSSEKQTALKSSYAQKTHRSNSKGARRPPNLSKYLRLNLAHRGKMLESAPSVLGPSWHDAVSSLGPTIVSAPDRTQLEDDSITVYQSPAVTKRRPPVTIWHYPRHKGIHQRSYLL